MAGSKRPIVSASQSPALFLQAVAMRTGIAESPAKLRAAALLAVIVSIGSAGQAIFKLSKKPGVIGGPRPSDFHCEPGAHTAGFGGLARQNSGC